MGNHQKLQNDIRGHRANRMVDYKAFATVIISGLLGASLAALPLVVSYGNEVSKASADSYNIGYEEGKTYWKPIVSTPVHAGTYMPTYFQNDQLWADAKYSDGTIETYGCGLTCAAMAISYLTGDIVTPLDLQGAVGDTMLTDRVNDMTKFSQYIEDAYGKTYDIKQHDPNPFWTYESMMEALDDNWIVFAGVHGQVGDKSYSGHVILLFKYDGKYYMRDPMSGENSMKQWSEDELKNLQIGSMNAVKGGLYGA